MSLVAFDLLREISQYEIGNTNKIFTTKSLKSRFSKMDFKELDNFLRSCESQITETKNNECLNDQQKKDTCKNVMIFYKLAKPITIKKLKESMGF